MCAQARARFMPCLTLVMGVCVCVRACMHIVFEEHTVPFLLGMRELGRVNSNLSLTPLKAVPLLQEHCQGRRGQ